MFNVKGNDYRVTKDDAFLTVAAEGERIAPPR
jgi:hypothetical protein